MDAYLTTDEARLLAQSLGVTLPEDDTALAAALLVASLDIDAAMRYQGRKYAVDGTQEREFPRIPDVSGLCAVSATVTGGSAETVWDWDDDANAAVVPDQVKMAVVFQAAWAASSTATETTRRLEAIKSGLKSQQIGSASEQYATIAEMTAGIGASALCERSLRLMQKYRISTGALL